MQRVLDRKPCRFCEFNHGLLAPRGEVCGVDAEVAYKALHAAVSRKRDAVTLEHAERVFRKSKGGLDMTPFDAAEWDVVKNELIAIGWGQ